MELQKAIELSPSHDGLLRCQAEAQAILERLLKSGSLDEKFYKSLMCGLICVREFEQTYPELYDLIFAMLEEVRPSESDDL